MLSELASLPSLYNALLTNSMRLSSIYYRIPYEAWLKVLGEEHPINEYYTRWLEIIANKFDEELSSDGFTDILSKNLDLWLDIHSILGKVYPMAIKSLDLVFEYYTFNLFRIYVLSISMLHAYRELDSSPYDVIHQDEKVRILHYKSNDGKYPLLIVYSMINRYHIMDISKDKSLVKKLLDNGVDVYLIEWGNIKHGEQLSLKDYVDDIDLAVNKIKQITNKDKISMLGYCWGGIPALIYAALHKDNLNSLILMAVPIDSSKDNTTLSRWTKAMDAKKFVKEYGHMDGQLLNMVFIMRNPIRYTILKYANLMKRIHDLDFLDTFLAVERWLYNTPIIPGKLYQEVLDYIYKDNMLISNRLELDGKRIDISIIDLPLLTIVAENDDLTSAASTLAINDHVSSKDKHTISIPGGHIGLCISSIAHKKLWPEVARWIIEKSTK